MSSQGFADSLSFVLRWEGGFVDNRADRGGKTNKGITQKVYDAWRAQQRLPQRDVQLLEDSEVQAIYRESYWLPSRCDLLEDKLDLVQFDTAVNMGVGRAVRFLQTVVGCTVDGGFGPGTQKALAACKQDAVIPTYCDVREKFYRDLVAGDATQAVFLKGWMNRLYALRKAAGLPGLEARTSDATPDFGDTGYIAKVPDDDETVTTGELSLTKLRVRANRVLEQLAGPNPDSTLEDAKRLVEQLRNAREYDLMSRVAEGVSRIDPKDAKNRRLYAQALIETGKATAAIDVLQTLIRRLPKDHPEWSEATGLLGRANKQIFFDTRDKVAPGARLALKQAIAAYRGPFEANPANTWHGVNLVALLANCRRLGIRVKGDPAEIAARLVKSLESTPADKRDAWYLPTLAEAYLGLNDWDAVERNVRAYAAADDAQAFLLASTLRQFTQIWNVQDSERGRGLISILRARLMQLPGGEVRIQSSDVSRLSKEEPSPTQLEAVLGTHGEQTFKWWKAGLTRALSVASIRHRLGSRAGTGFLVRTGDLGIAPPDELAVLTNYHVVNTQGVSPGIKPQDAEVVFEAVDSMPEFGVEKILWESPPAQCDASVLRLSKPVTGVDPLPVATSLPALEPSAQVYLIGHPGGRDLAFSFQDNELLDHEGPPNGHPQIPGVWRMHYRAPTEPGSSGSPVFNASAWEVIALHHLGGKTGMPRLNGQQGTYGANEGIAIHSISQMKKE